MKIAKNMLELVGNTPLVELEKIGNGLKGRLIAKLEYYNPGSSIKDRIGVAMVEAAEKEGKITSGTTVIEATSGNTGIALAWVCAVKGYQLILTMPDTMSKERINLLKGFGARLILTSGKKGMKGAIEKAEELSNTIQPSFLVRQFENPANPAVHEITTAREILNDTDRQVRALVSGVGTGGTITGVGKVLKSELADFTLFAVEPDDSPVLSGGTAGPHKIQGIGAGFIPDVMDTSLIDEVIRVKSNEAFEMSKRLAKEEGIMAGISAGAAVNAAVKIANRSEFAGKFVVVIIPDTGERYLSLHSFDD